MGERKATFDGWMGSLASCQAGQDVGVTKQFEVETKQTERERDSTREILMSLLPISFAISNTLVVQETCFDFAAYSSYT